MSTNAQPEPAGRTRESAFQSLRAILVVIGATVAMAIGFGSLGLTSIFMRPLEAGSAGRVPRRALLTPLRLPAWHLAGSARPAHGTTGSLMTSLGSTRQRSLPPLSMLRVCLHKKLNFSSATSQALRCGWARRTPPSPTASRTS
jgi:hypothetical protein